MFDDLDDVAVFASYDPSVTCRIVSDRGDKNCGAVAVNRFKCLESLGYGISGDHRAVTGQNDRKSVSSFKERCSLHNGVSRSALLFLENISDILT